MIVDNITDYVGNTPIIKITDGSQKNLADIYVKLEEFNPGGSIKTRVAFRMIKDAEERGILKRNTDQILIEPTGGNTGIGLAIAASVSGYKIILVVPDNYSQEKIEILKTYGATVILSDHNKGNDSHIMKAKELVKKNPNYVYLNQFINLSNPAAHYYGTGTEIVRDFKRDNIRIDAFIAAIGSGGTLTGVGKKIKEEFKDALVIGVQPEGCDILEKNFVPHKIQAIAVGILSPFVEKQIIDRMCCVNFENALYWMDYLAKKKGILVGISSGANIAAAMEMAKEFGKNKVIVTVAPDSGRSYLDIWSKNLMNKGEK